MTASQENGRISKFISRLQRGAHRTPHQNVRDQLLQLAEDSSQFNISQARFQQVASTLTPAAFFIIQHVAEQQNEAPNHMTSFAEELILTLISEEQEKARLYRSQSELSRNPKTIYATLPQVTHWRIPHYIFGIFNINRRNTPGTVYLINEPDLRFKLQILDVLIGDERTHALGHLRKFLVK